MPKLPWKVGDVNPGDYVLATKFSDGDPADPWCVGYFIGSENGRYFVGDSTNGPGPRGYRYNGFRHVDLIDEELGAWLVHNATELEKVPAGSINLREICARRMKFLAENSSTE